MSLDLPDEPRTAVDWITLEAVPLAVVTHTGVRLDDLRGLFDSSFRALGSAAESGAVRPVGPAVAVYDGDPADVFDLALGFPVAEVLEKATTVDGVEIVGHHLPAGSWAAFSHVGPYDGLTLSWERLLTGVREGGAEPHGLWVEVYVTEPGPEADPATTRTDLLLQVVLDDVV